MRKIKLFEEFVNEAESIMPLGSNLKLEKAADVIAQYINKKTRKGFVKFPFPMSVDLNGENVTGIMFYAESSNEGFMVTAQNSTTPGIVGSLVYFSNVDTNKADYTLTSKDFPIVKLVGEFVRLMDANYAKQVNESIVNEGRRKLRSFTNDELKLIQNRLAAGDSVRDIADDLVAPYSSIANIEKNVSVRTVQSPMEVKNEKTLEDKVQYLDELMQDIYDISGAIAQGAPFSSLFISGRAGTGKTFNVERAMKNAGLKEDEDYAMVSGAASVVMVYKKLFQYRDKILIFDDCDSVFRDETGRNILKAALDTKKVRNISYMKQSKTLYDPKDYENDPEGEYNAIESGLIPNKFSFTGKVIFISNLDKKTADPDGAIRSRSILIDVAPDDATLMERMKTLLPRLEPVEMSIEDKEEIYEFMKSANDVSMRTFVKAAGFKQAGMKNWKRMAQRYL